MKRYKPGIISHTDSIEYLDTCEVVMGEDPNGGWIRWDDIRPLFAEYMNSFELAGFIESLTEKRINCEEKI